MTNVAPGAYVILAKTDVFAGDTGSGTIDMDCRTTGH
jgi:hypothetical protein